MSELHDAANSLRVPGRFCADPTDLGIAYPHGGTALGMHQGLEVRIDMPVRLRRDESFANIVTEGIEIERGLLIGAVFRGITNAAAQKLFANTAVGGSSGDRVIESPGLSGSPKPLVRAVSERAFALLFSPTHPTLHPAVLLYRCLPMLEDGAALTLAVEAENGVGAIFVAAPDATTPFKVSRVGKLADLVL